MTYSSYSSYKYSSVRAGFGELFGLEPNDLTTQQLQKINADKLIELIDKDGRIDQVLSDGMAKEKDIAAWTILAHVDESGAQFIPKTIATYNEKITQTESAELEKKSSWGREHYIYWILLTDENKKNEALRITNQKDSAFKAHDMDTVWWFQKFPVVADQLVKYILEHSNAYKTAATKFARTLPQPLLNTYIENIFKCEKSIYMYALSNPATPSKYIVKALRAIAGKKRRVPGINVELSKDMLCLIPPITRLQVLETLFYHMHDGKVTFKDIKTVEDLQTLLFSAAIQQNERIVRVIERFKYLYTRRY